MDRLLKALKMANSLPEKPNDGVARIETAEEIAINVLACDLFIGKDGRINMAQVNEFEHYAPCKIGPAERDSFGWLIGYICYNGRTYYFG